MIRFIIKALLLTGKTLALLIGVLLLVFALKYITCPVYTFNKGKPFAGKKIYNPYRDMDPGQWRKGNFQIQSYAWAGITSGRGNTNEDIYNLYKSLGYDVIATSDYQKINTFGLDKPAYIPVYEHGYGVLKSHQVLVGANKVLWKDYPFYQTIHNKQHIINSLRKDNELIYLAHPRLRNGYTVDEMKILTGYDGIEVLNNYCTSLEHWDAALSSGNYITILGNDDAHDISKPDEVGHHCTFINSPSVNKSDIISSLKSGNAYGAKIRKIHGESIEEKLIRTKVLPELVRFEVRNDTLFIATDSVVTEIRFIGQGGKLLETAGNTNEAFYAINTADTYVRTEIHYSAESAFYLNPICRYDGKTPGQIPPPEIDNFKTWLLRIIGFATLIFLGINIYILRKRIKRKVA